MRVIILGPWPRIPRAMTSVVNVMSKKGFKTAIMEKGK